MGKILMYDDSGATTYIEMCTFSIVYRSTKIDSNWLKHPVSKTGGMLVLSNMFIGEDMAATYWG